MRPLGRCATFFREGIDMNKLEAIKQGLEWQAMAAEWSNCRNTTMRQASGLFDSGRSATDEAYSYVSIITHHVRVKLGARFSRREQVPPEIG